MMQPMNTNTAPSLAMARTASLAQAADAHAQRVDALYPRATPAMRQVLLGLARMRARRGLRLPAHAAAARTQYAAGLAVFEQPPRSVAHVRDFQIPLADNHFVRARLYCDDPDFSPQSAKPALLYLHGGGFVVGDLNTHDGLCRDLAADSGAAIIALDYRLAPEHPFPAAFDDAWGALRWLAVHGQDLGLCPQRLAVGGDSAGGTLAAACAIAARDAALHVALQVLIYPGTRPIQDSASHQRWADDLLLPSPSLQWFFQQYAPDAPQRADWRFAPMQATQTAGGLDGAADALVVLAEYDPMTDEGIAYADALRWADVPVQLEIYAGVTHEFLQMPAALPEARAARVDIARVVREKLMVEKIEKG